MAKRKGKQSAPSKTETPANSIIHLAADTTDSDLKAFEDATQLNFQGQTTWFALTSKVAVPWPDMVHTMDAIHARKYMTEDYDPDKSMLKYSADLILEQMRESQNKGFMLPKSTDDPTGSLYVQLPTEKFHTIDKEGNIGQPIATVTKDMTEPEIDTLFTEKSQDEGLSL